MDKIADYLLNLDHPDGAGKAKFFISHGFETSEPEVLLLAFHQHAEANDIEEVVPGPYGTKTTVRCTISTPDGRNPCIRAVWINENGGSGQRLVTAYPATASIEG